MPKSRGWLFLMVVTAMLAACNPFAEPTPLPTPVVTAPPSTTGPRFVGGGVTASGKIVPVQDADLSFTVSGLVETVAVEEGSHVWAGDVLVVLETEAIQADLAQVQASVDAAEANLSQLTAGPRPEEIGAAEQDVATAQAQVAQAEASLAAAEAQHAVARLGIEAAKADVQAAEAHLRQVESGAPAGEIAAAKADIELAEVELRQAQAAYDQVKHATDLLMRPEAMALEKATIAHEAARARCEAVMNRPAAGDRQAAAAQVTAAQVQVTRAEHQAQAVRSEVAEASSALQAAEANRLHAEERLSLLKAGPRQEEIAAAEAQLAQAQARLEAAETRLEETTLRAPFSGTVAAPKVSPGETVAPNQVVVSLADLSQFQVQTTDLSERDIGRVQVDQPATVYVEGLDREIEGRVAGIAPEAETIGGDVVYNVYIGLPDHPSELRWGMSVEVQINTG